MEDQLAKFGVTCRQHSDGIEIDGMDYTQLRQPQDGIDCYDDHRIAMSFSILALVAPHGTLIRLVHSICSLRPISLTPKCTQRKGMRWENVARLVGHTTRAFWRIYTGSGHRYFP